MEGSGEAGTAVRPALNDRRPGDGYPVLERHPAAAPVRGPANKAAGMSRREYAEELCRYHAPDEAQREAHERIAQAAEQFVMAILDTCPESADATTALRAVREARMWANSAIALRGLV